MLFWKRDIEKYHKKYGRLSMLEHGACILLMDACYDREKFPTEEEAYDWTLTRSESEREAIKYVLKVCFRLQDGVYVNDEIIDAFNVYKSNCSKNTEVAKLREEKKRAARGGYSQTQTTHQPAPDNHETARGVNDSWQSVHQPAPDNHETARNQVTNKPINQVTNNKTKTPRQGAAQALLAEYGVNDQQIIDDWLKLRKSKNLPVTKTALDGIAKQAESAGMSLENAIRICCENGWGGFKAEWIGKTELQKNNNQGCNLSQIGQRTHDAAMEFLNEGGAL
jgi:uncharacterized protein YdaU (DUF1376 family)